MRRRTSSCGTEVPLIRMQAEKWIQAISSIPPKDSPERRRVTTRDRARVGTSGSARAAFPIRWGASTFGDLLPSCCHTTKSNPDCRLQP